MNVMMMTMLNRNGGGDSTQPQPPPISPMNDSEIYSFVFEVVNKS
jgi:hypothetical protein